MKATGTLDARTQARLAARRREHVVQLQKALKETGHDPGSADGVMGSQTRAAVQRYASAPAPSSQTGSYEVIDRLKRAYEASLQQTP